MRADSISESKLSTVPAAPGNVLVLPKPRSHFSPWFSSTVVAVGLLGLALLLQWLSGAYRGEFGAYPDEGAHYITGLMLHDYILHGHLSSFRAFAENYYLHYPKVALGHWPPFFYIVQSLWMLIFSVSRPSMLGLMALITTLTALTLYRVLADELGTVLAITAALFFIGLPVVQTNSAMVMDDTLVGLLSFWAALSFGRFIEREKWQDAARFGLLSAFAILTKGTSLALALIPLASLLATRRWSLFRRPAFWLPVAIVVPLCAPWYWLTRQMLAGYAEQTQSPASVSAFAVRFYAVHSLRIFGFVLVALAAVGFLVKLTFPPRRVNPRWTALAALIFATGILICIVPSLSISGQHQFMTIEERFLVPIIPAVLAFSFAGLDYLAHHVGHDWLDLQKRRMVLASIIIVLFTLTTFSIPRGVSFGFAPVAEYLLSQPELTKSVVLISSDAIGDSMLISEVAMREKRPGHFVLRASKVLCDCSWSGEQQISRYPTPRALMEYFDHSPIEIVVNDQSIPPHSVFGFHHVLDDAIKAYPQRWKLIGTYPSTRNGVLHPEGIQLYRVSGTDPSAPVVIDLRQMLHKAIQSQIR